MKIYFTSIKGRRQSNEDSHNIILNKSLNNNFKINLLSIYDGHGGDKISNFLKNNIPLLYCNTKLKYPLTRKYHIKIFDFLQKRIISGKYGYLQGSTCLLNILYRYNNDIYMNILNLGDCRLTIVNKNDTYEQITIDHKPDDKIEAKRINDIGGEIYKDSEGVYRIGNLSLSRAFGDGDNAPYISHVPDIYTIKITKQNEFIVMACDGLWDVIENNELYKLLKEYQTKKIVNYASKLATEALERGSTDNISIIILELDNIDLV